MRSCWSGFFSVKRLRWVCLSALLLVSIASSATAQTRDLPVADSVRTTTSLPDSTQPDTAELAPPPTKRFSWTDRWRVMPQPDSTRSSDPRAERKALRDSLRQLRRDSLALAWPIPGRATRMSVLLPGLGQFYNAGLGRPNVTTSSKLFHLAKIPVIYGLMGLTVSLALSNDSKFQRFKSSYIAKINNAAIPDTVPNRAALLLPDDFPTASADAVRLQRDFFRRSRDQAVFWTVVIYALNGVEAFVSAHLRSFDVSDNLSLHVSPAVDLRPPSALDLSPQLQLSARLSLRLSP